MGRLTQMRSSSAKSSKAKYKRPRLPKISSEHPTNLQEFDDDKENAQKGPTRRARTSRDGNLKLDEMVGKVDNVNAGQIVDELTSQLDDIDLDKEQSHIHEGFMREALAMAELALATDETPVGCVFVYQGKIIARGMNATNRTLNGTRHAEYMAISSILSPSPYTTVYSKTKFAGADSTRTLDQDIPAPLPASVLRDTVVYVTVEPCIMCASLLRQYGIKKVYYGASNDKFGGTGGVLNIHYDEVGNLPQYEVSGGWLREEAILALRKFYVQENDKAPEPRNKKERKLKTEILPFQKPATPALSTTRNKRFSKTPTPSGSSASSLAERKTSQSAGSSASSLAEARRGHVKEDNRSNATRMPSNVSVKT